MSDDEQVKSIRVEVLERLGKLEGKIDVLITTNKIHSDHCDVDRGKISTSISDLEKKQSWILGVGSACVVAFGALAAYFKGGGSV